MATQYLPIRTCIGLQSKLTTGPGCFVVTALTDKGETPIQCPPSCRTDAPVTPPPTECVNYFLQDVTETTANFSWSAYPGATGYNVYIAPDADPMNYVLEYENISVSVLPIACQNVIVTALTASGETPQCLPLHFCSDSIAPCGIVSFDPGALMPQAWWKADSFPNSTPAGTLIGEGAYVWEDQSGMGRDAIVRLPGGLHSPTYQPNTFGTKPGIWFGGFPVGGTGLVQLIFPTLVTSGEFTFVAVMKPLDGGLPVSPILSANLYFPAATPIWMDLSDKQAARTSVDFQRNSNPYCLTPAQASSDGAGTHMRCISVRRNSSNEIKFYESLMEQGPTFVDSGSMTVEWIGGAPGYPNPLATTDFTGGIGELLIFDRHLSDMEMTRLVEEYLRPRWCFVDCATAGDL